MGWLQCLFRHRNLYNELAEELRQHLEEKTEYFMREGLPRKEAEQAARRAFGNPILIEQRSREVWQRPFWADTSSATRYLVRSPGIALATIFVVALGIGANAAIFTLTWNIVLKALPVPHPNRLVDYERHNGNKMIGISGPEYALLRKKQRSCIDLLAWQSDWTSVREGAHTTRRIAQLLTGNSFRVLQMQPFLGAPFDERNDRSPGAGVIPVILSFDYWQKEFHGDKSVIGRSLAVNNHAVVVVGVMPRAFKGLTANLQPAIYLPMSFADILIGRDYRASPNHFGYFVLGRLKPGVTETHALAEARALEPGIRNEIQVTGTLSRRLVKDYRLTVRDGRGGVSWLKMTYESPLLVLQGLVTFLLLLCCVVIALVMLARVSRRQREYALRAALDASRLRIIRQVLVETLLLALPGLAAGPFLGWAGAHAVVDMMGPRGTPSAMNLCPNGAILGFHFLSTLIIVLGTGLLPAFRATGTAAVLDLQAVNCEGVIRF